MLTDAGDAIRYIENNLKIKLDKSFNFTTGEYVINVKLLLNNTVISEDRITFES